MTKPNDNSTLKEIRDYKRANKLNKPDTRHGKKKENTKQN